MTSNSHGSWGTNELFLSEIPVKLWKGSHTKHFSVQCWSNSSGFHWPDHAIQPSPLQLGSECLIIPGLHGWLQCFAMEQWQQLGLHCLTTGYSTCSSWPGLTALWGTPRSVEKKRNPEGISLANRATAFQTQLSTHRMCAKLEISLTKLQPPFYTRTEGCPTEHCEVSTFLRAQTPSGFTLSKNLTCLSSLPELYLHPKSNLCTLSWREEFSMILMCAIE